MNKVKHIPWKIAFGLAITMAILGLLSFISAEASAEHIWCKTDVLAKSIMSGGGTWQMFITDSGYVIYRTYERSDYSCSIAIPKWAEDIVVAINDTTICRVVK